MFINSLVDIEISFSNLLYMYICLIISCMHTYTHTFRFSPGLQYVHDFCLICLQIHPKLNQMDQDKVARIYSDLRKESLVRPMKFFMF